MRIDTPIQKETWEKKSSLVDLDRWGGGGAVHFTAENLSTLLSIELICTYFPCSALHYKVNKKKLKQKIQYMYSFNAKQFNSLDCIELHCLVNCCFAVHFNVLDWTAPPTLHYTALHWVKFEISCYYKIYITLLLCFYEKSRIWETPIFQTMLIEATIQKTRHGRPHW